MDRNNLLYLITFFVVAGFITLFLIEYVFKKWKCDEGKCNKVFGGDYTHLKDCLNSKECSKTSSNAIKSEESANVSITEPPSGYNCFNNQCQVSTNGRGAYSSIDECVNVCPIVQQTVVEVPTYPYRYPYEYPYGYPYGYENSYRFYPRRWSPRRRHYYSYQRPESKPIPPQAPRVGSQAPRVGSQTPTVRSHPLPGSGGRMT